MRTSPSGTGPFRLRRSSSPASSSRSTTPVSYSTIVANVERSGRSELDATHGFLREALARVRDWSFV